MLSAKVALLRDFFCTLMFNDLWSIILDFTLLFYLRKTPVPAF